MKKLTAALLILVLCLGVFTMAGCSKEEETKRVSPFEGMNLEEYITLPDYNVFDVEEPKVSITEAQVDAEIEARLQAAATVETVTEGKVEKGDTILMDYAGFLENGETSPNMNAKDAEIVLGSGRLIDGFEEGLYGAEIGKTVSLNLEFPDPYPNNEEVAGKPVTFEVTVNSKKVVIPAELNEEFIKNNSNVSTEAEYRDFVKGQLEQSEYDNQLYDLKEILYSQIVDETEVIKFAEDQLEAMKNTLRLQHEEAAKQQGYEDWDKFRDEYFGIDQAEYEEQLRMYAESLLTQEMIVYRIAEVENLDITDEEYQKAIDNMLAMLGMDAETFSMYIGMTVEEYAEENNLYRDLLLTKELDVIYDRLLNK